MGTSSILAAVILAAIAGVKGWSFQLETLVHLVLVVEQMLTTGGGWQDQVGGIYPGIKVGHTESRDGPTTLTVFFVLFEQVAESSASLPLRVKTHLLGVGNLHLLHTLNERLFVVYTGKTRLAKDLLQRVLRCGRCFGVVIVPNVFT